MCYFKTGYPGLSSPLKRTGLIQLRELLKGRSTVNKHVKYSAEVHNHKHFCLWGGGQYSYVYQNVCNVSGGTGEGCFHPFATMINLGGKKNGGFLNLSFEP